VDFFLPWLFNLVLQSADIKKILFLAQTNVPETLDGRMDIINILFEICRKYPDKYVYLKVRNRTKHQLNFKHHELFHYNDLVNIFKRHNEIPSNFLICDTELNKLFDEVDFCITCNSTAGIESICHGIQTAFYLDYDFQKDTFLKDESLKYFDKSNLIYSKYEVINLDKREINEEWLLNNTCEANELSIIFSKVKIE